MRSVPIVAILLVLALGLDACAEAAAPLAGTAFTNWVQMRFVRIEPGEFVMGQGDAPPRTRDEWLQRDYDEAPAHRVRISKPFYLAIHEVTNAQYGQYDPRHRERWAGKGAGSQDTDPVTFVTWQQAVAYCDWLSKREGRPYRLPTEAEWEYACRAGTTTPWNTGERITAQQANLGLAKDGRSRQGVVAVGSYPANGWGLFDVHGNVAEWCSDWYGPYEPGLQCDPVGRSDGYGARRSRLELAAHRQPRRQSFHSLCEPFRPPARGRQPLHGVPRRLRGVAELEAAAGGRSSLSEGRKTARRPEARSRSHQTLFPRLQESRQGSHVAQGPVGTSLLLEPLHGGLARALTATSWRPGTQPLPSWAAKCPGRQPVAQETIVGIRSPPSSMSRM